MGAVLQVPRWPAARPPSAVDGQDDYDESPRELKFELPAEVRKGDPGTAGNQPDEVVMMACGCGAAVLRHLQVSAALLIAGPDQAATVLLAAYLQALHGLLQYQHPSQVRRRRRRRPRGQQARPTMPISPPL